MWQNYYFSAFEATLLVFLVLLQSTHVLSYSPKSVWTTKNIHSRLVLHQTREVHTTYNHEVSDDNDDINNSNNNVSSDRRGFLRRTCAAGLVGIFTGITGNNIEPSNALASYSSNARNMERLNAGDASGGGVFDNNPSTESGRRRRAMTGCKNAIAREEAADSILKLSSANALSEKDCNLRVLGGDSEFMLEALRILDCPTCPYGISSSRK